MYLLVQVYAGECIGPRSISDVLHCCSSHLRQDLLLNLKCTWIWLGLLAGQQSCCPMSPYPASHAGFNCSSHYLCAVTQVLTTRGKSPWVHGNIYFIAMQEHSITTGSLLQIGCNAVSWSPAVVPGSLIDQPSGQKPNYIKKFASGGCDNLIKLWRSVSCVDISSAACHCSATVYKK